MHTETLKKELKVVAEAGRQEVFLEREFDAPREMVFRAFHEPELLKKWLGPDNLEMTIDYYESKSGGKYRYIHTDEKGNAHAFHGVIHEVTAPIRSIQTFEYEGLPERGHVSLDTALFHELPGNRTKVVLHSIFRSVADRDGMLMSGMDKGVNEGFRKLDALLEAGL